MTTQTELRIAALEKAIELAEQNHAISMSSEAIVSDAKKFLSFLEGPDHGQQTDTHDKV